jgi:two-component system response regulator HydG
MIGVSEAMRQVVVLLARAAGSDCAILIEGESGTGKELVARHLHTAGPRRDQPFIPVNCAGVGEALFESQFFGHLRGSFTGADRDMLGWVRSAEGGTLLLDEVSEIPLGLQAKLLRVLDDGEVMPVGATAPRRVDVRFIAATNRQMKEEVVRGRFRLDLYHRLNVVGIRLPPLRDRTEDIGPLLDHFVARYAAKYARPAIRMSPEVLATLGRYPWPGNVRELVAWVERLYVTGLSPEASAAALVEGEAGGVGLPSTGATAPVMTLEEAERLAILRAMKATDNKLNEAARLLGTHRNTLSRKLQLYHVA